MMVVEIRGCGLAGVCVGWWLWRRGVEFCFVGERGRGASWAAAGLMNPVTGKGMNVSWETGRFLGEAKRFYREVEAELGREYFRESGVLRVFRSGEEREKFAGKRGELAEWVGDEFEEVEGVKGGEFGGVCWEGGGWLGVRDFVRDSLAFFGEGASGEGPVVFCEGAKGLREGPFSFLPTRLAKGEILTLRGPGWGEERILNRGGWVIPLGEDLYRVG
ncbi:MAG: FAD-dependent oxidoreductase, partial [Verrucomicrobiota bacterium]